jgi:hypothetical protein
VVNSRFLAQVHVPNLPLELPPIVAQQDKPTVQMVALGELRGQLSPANVVLAQINVSLIMMLALLFVVEKEINIVVRILNLR